MARRTIEVGALARVEGEGGLRVRIEGDRVTDVRLDVFEPPRFFEALLRGRDFTEAPDVTARICGICPVAYQMSAVHAMEAACGVRVDGALRDLRRLLYCGEWIESHALHVYLLHAPDFFGAESALHLAQADPERVKQGLRLKKAGNTLMRVLGGREIHPINVRIGGFYRVPTKAELRALVPELEWARDAAVDMVRWVAALPFPDLERDYELVALVHPDEYPMNEGRVTSTGGLDLEAAQFLDAFAEEQVPHSTALHARIRARNSYLVGPLARFALNRRLLGDELCRLADDAGLGERVTNPFKSIVVRALETVYACEEALRIIGRYEPPAEPAVPVVPRAAAGHAATEAPRGLLYHRYRIDARGLIAEARIIPPTAQNMATIEADLAELVARSLDLDDAALQWRCEQAVRNHDPCISCSVHFLDLRVERR